MYNKLSPKQIYNLGKKYHRENKYKKSIGFFKQVIKNKHSPSKLIAEAKYRCGSIFIELKQYKKALIYLKEAVADQNSTPKVKIYAKYSCGIAYKELENYTMAFKYFRDVADNQNSPLGLKVEAKYWCGYVCNKLKDYKITFKYLNEVIFDDNLLPKLKNSAVWLPFKTLTKLKKLEMVYEFCTKNIKQLILLTNIQMLARLQTLRHLLLLKKKTQQNQNNYNIEDINQLIEKLILNRGICGGYSKTNSMGVALFGKKMWEMVFGYFLYWHDEDLDKVLPTNLQEALGTPNPKITRLQFNEMMVHNLLLYQQRAYLLCKKTFFQKEKRMLFAPFVEKNTQSELFKMIEYTKNGKIYTSCIVISEELLTLSSLTQYVIPYMDSKNDACFISGNRHSSRIEVIFDEKTGKKKIIYVDRNRKEFLSENPNEILNHMYRAHNINSAYQQLHVNLITYLPKTKNKATEFKNKNDAKKFLKKDSSFPSPEHLNLCFKLFPQKTLTKLSKLSIHSIQEYLDQDVSKKNFALCYFDTFKKIIDYHKYNKFNFKKNEFAEFKQKFEQAQNSSMEMKNFCFR
jgi:tetratricopeptide (TPR) repeat protein